MIPKMIHYCWFGEKEKPAIIDKYIDSWKKFFPDYKIIEWNEENFDIDACSYVKEAYAAQKYAFVSDYVRLYALYQHGGIYFDTDIEVRKDIGELLANDKMLLGFEDEHYVMTGFIAAEPGLQCFKELLNIYDEKKFLLPNGKFDTLPNPVIVTEVMEHYGLITNGKLQSFGDNYSIYPYEYFSAFNIAYQRLNITSNTYLIHHCMGTWQTTKDRLKPRIKSIILRIIGEKNFLKLKRRFYKKS